MHCMRPLSKINKHEDSFSQIQSNWWASEPVLNQIENKKRIIATFPPSPAATNRECSNMAIVCCAILCVCIKLYC